VAQFETSKLEGRKENGMTWEGIQRIEKSVRDLDAYIDRHLLMQV
jgi:hypothetical protein